MSTRSNKLKVLPVNLAYAGNGTIEFQVPPVKKAEEIRLKLRYPLTSSGTNSKIPLSDPFYFKFLNDVRKTGSISIDGWVRMPGEDADTPPDFRTMVQLDGDIICKVGAAIFKENQWRELMKGHELVRTRFLNELERFIRFFFWKILAYAGAAISLPTGLTYLMRFLFS